MCAHRSLQSSSPCKCMQGLLTYASISPKQSRCPHHSAAKIALQGSYNCSSHKVHRRIYFIHLDNDHMENSRAQLPNLKRCPTHSSTCGSLMTRCTAITRVIYTIHRAHHSHKEGFEQVHSKTVHINGKLFMTSHSSSSWSA